MKNPSNRVSKLKKGDFKPLEFFFSENSWVFGEKMKMDQKWSKNPEKVRNLFQAWFPIIFIIWAHKIQNFGIFGRFAPFFGHFWCFSSVANLPGEGSPKINFRTRFGKFGSNPEDWDHKNDIFIGKTHLKGSKRVF